MAAASSYRAEMIGLSERDRTMLRSLLAATQARTGLHWDGDANQPPIHFIDIDSPEGADFWQSLADSARSRSAILLSQNEPPAQGTRWLPKPLRSSALLGALGHIVMPVRTNIVTPAPATSPAPAPSAVDVSTSTRSLLQVLDAGGTGTAQVLKSPHWPDLIISSGGDYAMRTGPLESYVAGFEASLDVASISKYTGGPLDDTLRTSLDTLRWLALLHAPLAEIADRLPRPAHARLSGLPGFTHLPHSLQHMRMAAWLTKHSASPQELADIVSVDEETAQRFLGACSALGLLQEVSETSMAEEAESAPPVIEGTEDLPAVNALKNGEALSVLERLRATREQNRGHAVAATRGVSNS